MFRRLLLYTTLILVLVSCSDRDENIDSITPDGKVSVDVALELPQQEDVAIPTRGAIAGTEISNIDLLVFNTSGTFIERVQVDGSDIVIEGDKVKFNTLLKASATKCTIHFIANARKKSDGSDRLNFSDLQLNVSKEADMLRLHTNHAATSNQSVLLPELMWSKKVLSSLHINTQVDQVKLLRTWANIMVQKSRTVQSANLADFKIERMTLHSGYLNGYLLPTNHANLEVSTPTASRAYKDGGVWDYSKLWIDGENPSLYLNERSNTETDFISVILKASFRGEIGFYRIFLRNSTGMMDIIRNHRYTISIIDVTAAGYKTVEEAIAGEPSNAIKVEVFDSNPDYPIVLANTKEHVSFTHNESRIWSTVNDLQSVAICTVYSSNGRIPSITAKPSWVEGIEVVPVVSNQYQIRLHIKRASAIKQDGLCKISCGNLHLDFSVVWDKMVNAETSIPLIDNTLSNWEVRINPNSSSSLFLSNKATVYNEREGVYNISSKIFTKAYLFVKKGKPAKGNANLFYKKGDKLMSSNLILM